MTIVGVILFFWPGTGIVTVAWVLAAAFAIALSCSSSRSG